MRKILALVLAVWFLPLFFIVVTANHVLDTVSKPDVVIGMVDNAEIFNYVYDHLMENLVHDVVSKGVEVDSGLSDSSEPMTLSFDDPDVAAAAITSSLETLVPREYLKQKFEESMRGVVPYVTGKTDEFEIDLEVQERVRAVPDAVRVLVLELNLIEQVTDDLLVPQIAEFTSQISGNALGISFTEQENEDNTRVIFAPEWVEQQLFGAIDEITPYFAGDSDGFEIEIELDNRVVVVGEILKDKIKAEDTLYQLVFTKVIDPAIQNTVDQSTSVGFGVSLSEQEVTEAVEVIAPRDWVRGHGDAVIDVLVEYMIGNSDDLNYSIDMSERKAAAVAELQGLARTKLVRTLEVLPTCGSSAERFSAAAAVTSGKVPPCLSGGPMINIALNSFVPKMDQQVEAFVVDQIPGEISYSLSDFGSQAGGSENPFEDARKRVLEGLSFSEQDLLNMISDENDPESRADAEEKLKTLAAGVVITEKDFIDALGPDLSQQFEDVRGYMKTGLAIRWLLWVVVLIPLIAIAFIAGGGWMGRLKWAGGVAAVVALIVYLGIGVGWSFVDVAIEQNPDFAVDVNPEFRTDYPRLAAELESDEPVVRLQRALESWQRGWRSQTVPWIIAGLLAFAVGVVWPRTKALRGDRKIPWPPLGKTGGPSVPAPAAVPPPGTVTDVAEIDLDEDDDLDYKPGEDDPDLDPDSGSKPGTSTSQF